MWMLPEAVAGGVHCTWIVLVGEGSVCSIHSRPLSAQPPAGIGWLLEHTTLWFWPAVKLPACCVEGPLSRRAVISNPNTTAAASVTVMVSVCACPGVYTRPPGKATFTLPPPPFNAVPRWHRVQATPGWSPGAGVTPAGGPKGNAHTRLAPPIHRSAAAAHCIPVR